MLNTITGETERDKQQAIGPSEIGNPCDHCVAVALTRKYPEYRPSHVVEKQGFSLKAWLGTAVHEKLFTDLDHPSAIKENYLPGNTEPGEVVVYEMQDYGKIKAHIDLFFLRTGTVVDYKTTEMKKIIEMRTKGVHAVHPGHIFQGMLYGYGLEQEGYKIHDVGLIYIPRDSNDIRDIWPAFADYRRDIAEDALLNLERIWETIRKGDWDFASAPGCFVCDRNYF